MTVIETYLADISKMVEPQLEQLLPEQKGEARILAEAMRYSVMNGGKRLRPALFCATMQAFGKDPHKYLPYAAAIEMIHCYSLIHDDLPAMDDDELRRGKPTCHIVYGEAMAILAGDALLSLAAQILSSPLADIEPANQLAAANVIMGSAGKMVAGQAIEIAANADTVDIPLLKAVYEGKTAALFQAAVVGAAALCAASAAQKQDLMQYCSALGLAFQITDDILDIKGAAGLLGKPLGSDLKNDKKTYPALLGCAAAEQEASKAATAAENAIAQFGETAAILRLFPHFFVDRDR